MAWEQDRTDVLVQAFKLTGIVSKEIVAPNAMSIFAAVLCHP
jgi:hypothetical protein